jgi:hypothetical protein
VWRGRRILVAAALIAIASGAGQADTFHFVYSDGTYSVDAFLNATNLNNGSYRAISVVSGTFNGNAITLLSEGLLFNDNLFYPEQSPLLTPNTSSFGSQNAGIGFNSAINNDRLVVYYDVNGDAGNGPNTYEAFDLLDSSPAFSRGSLSITTNPGPLPGAGSVSYLLLMVGAAWGWRKVAFIGARHAARSALYALRTAAPPSVSN